MQPFLNKRVITKNNTKPLSHPFSQQCLVSKRQLGTRKKYLNDFGVKKVCKTCGKCKPFEVIKDVDDYRVNLGDFCSLPCACEYVSARCLKCETKRTSIFNDGLCKCFFNPFFESLLVTKFAETIFAPFNRKFILLLIKENKLKAVRQEHAHHHPSKRRRC